MYTSLFKTTSFVTGGQRQEGHHKIQASLVQWVPGQSDLQSAHPYTNYTCIMDVCVIIDNTGVIVFTTNSQVTNMLRLKDFMPKI